MTSRVEILGAMVALAGLGGLSPRLKLRPSREHCVLCRKPIPPGRAGRACEECRQSKGAYKPNDDYTRWLKERGASHAHCPSGQCEHPQPFMMDGKLYCGRCAVKFGELVEMVPCIPANCED